MCGRGATSACAASGRTNVVTRIAATCPFTPAAPRRGDAPVLCPKCSSSAAKARDRRTPGWRYTPSPRSPWRLGRRMGVGYRGSVMLERAPPPRGLDHVPTAPSDGPRETASRVLRKDGSANKSLRRRVLGVACGGGRRLARSVRARVREGCRRGRRRVVGGGARAPRFTPAAAFRGRRARLAPFAGSAQYPLWSGARHQIRAARSV